MFFLLPAQDHRQAGENHTKGVSGKHLIPCSPYRPGAGAHVPCPTLILGVLSHLFILKQDTPGECESGESPSIRGELGANFPGPACSATTPEVGRKSQTTQRLNSAELGWGWCGLRSMRVCMAKPACFLKWDFQGREGRGCGRWTWGRAVGAVSRRFDVDLKRRGTLPLLKNRHLSLQDAEAGDLRSIREQPERFLSTHLRESRQDWTGKRGGRPSTTWEGRRVVSRQLGHKGHTEGPWQIFSEVGEAVEQVRGQDSPNLARDS